MSKTIWIINQYASTPEFGYAGRHYYLGRELAKAGYNVYLIASSAHHLLRKKPVFDSKFQFQSDGRFTVVWVRMPDYDEAHSKARVLGWFLFPWRIQRLKSIIRHAPDVVVCSSPSLFSFFGAKRIARGFGARLVFEVRDIWPLTLTEIGGLSRSNPFIKLMQMVEDKAYRDSEIVISNLNKAVDHMVSRGMASEKFYWIPNGFCLEEVESRETLSVESLAMLPDRKFIVGYTGTIGVANALDTFIEAAEILKNNADIAFVLVGHGKEKQTLMQYVEEKYLDNVFFLEPVPKIQVQDMLSKFDACYLGWLDDTLYRFGIGANKIPEYLYSGKPIIHAFSGIGDPIAESGSGISVPAEDPVKLAGAILKLFDMSQSERREIGRKGHKVAMERYEYGRLARQFCDVLFPEGGS